MFKIGDTVRFKRFIITEEFLYTQSKSLNISERLLCGKLTILNISAGCLYIKELCCWYDIYRFELIHISQGYNLCKCGTLTIKTVCCDCK